MKKKHKTLIILTSILVLIFIVNLSFYLYKQIAAKANIVDNSTWMDAIDDDTKLIDIVIPGSHNSGTYSMPYFSECQTLTIENQLMIGVRYFDLRVNNNDGKYVIYHSIINGVEFEPIISSISEFIKNHPTECLILDFQHFINSDSIVFDFINEYLSSYYLVNDSSMSDLEFISTITLKDVRGKCVILFGENSQYTSYNYIFDRNDDDCNKTGSSLNSKYISSENGKSSKNYINESIPLYIQNIKDKINNEGYKGLFVLQSQLTDTKLIFGPLSREISHNKNMSKYINDLPNNEDFSLINIIMRDYVNSNKINDIIRLNYYKNNIKQEKLNDFKTSFDIE